MRRKSRGISRSGPVSISSLTGRPPNRIALSVDEWHDQVGRWPPMPTAQCRRPLCLSPGHSRPHNVRSNDPDRSDVSEVITARFRFDDPTRPTLEHNLNAQTGQREFECMRSDHPVQVGSRKVLSIDHLRHRSFDKAASTAVKLTVFRLEERIETPLATLQSLSPDYRTLCGRASRRGGRAQYRLLRTRNSGTTPLE